MKPITLLIAAVMAAGLAGCTQPVSTVDNPIGITEAEYDRVFNSAVAVLRDMRFSVDRKDRRFGVVTTEPLMAASAFEPWREDNTTRRQVIRNTLNTQRRTVRVEIMPGPERQPDPAAEAGTTAVEPNYQLRVLVEVDRRHLPPRNLHTAAMHRVGYREAEYRFRPIETEAGVQRAFWQRVGRDEHLERRLVEAILERANAAL